MLGYIVTRLSLIVPTFIGVTFLVFCITRVVPGGPMEQMLMQMRFGSGEHQSGSQNSNQSISQEQIDMLNAYYGFDKPAWKAYLEWLAKLAKLDLGESSRYNDPVWDMIVERLPVSCFFGFTTLFLTYLICIPLGIFKAVRHKSTLDSLSSVLVFVGQSAPPFVVAIGLLVVFSSRLGWFPLGGFVSEDFESFTFSQKILDLAHHTFLPLLSYLLGSFAIMTFVMKNSLIEQLSQGYMRTAIAKGNSFKSAVFKHALRNSLIPMATHFGNNISVILSGSFLVERIFNIDGFGLLAYESLVERDYPVVLGVLVLSSLLLLVGNIVSDVCVALVDPRVKFQRQG